MRKVVGSWRRSVNCGLDLLAIGDKAEDLGSAHHGSHTGRRLPILDCEIAQLIRMTAIP